MARFEAIIDDAQFDLQMNVDARIMIQMTQKTVPYIRMYLKSDHERVVFFESDLRRMLDKLIEVKNGL